ncbi:DNA (cytosine-5-)-methyltransferase [Aeromonas salmonicida]
MIYGSVCSGIEAASLAWEPIGWKPAWFAEIEPFPSAVLAHHWPHVTNLGDMTKIATAVLKGDVVAPDILVGGTPCQAFSVAGARQGLADDRGFLTIKYVELANAIDQKRAAAGAVPCIIVWENVPGVLSSKDNAFGAFLGFLSGEECELVSPGGKWENAGYVHGPKRSIAWRVLDAQYFGVAQRRRRVFVVSSARKGFDPTEILFEREGVRRDTPPSREVGQKAAGHAGASFKVGSHWDGYEYAHPTLSQSHNTGGIGASNQELFSQRGAGLVPTVCGADDNQGQAGHLIAAFGQNNTSGPVHVSHALNAHSGPHGRLDFESETFLVKAVHGTQDPDVNVELAHTLGRNHGQENAVAYTTKLHNTTSNGAGKFYEEYTVSLDRSSPPPALVSTMAVRRLTPVECERLQGFPDNHTMIPAAKRNKLIADELAYLRRHFPLIPEEEAHRMAADGPRYKAIGNSMAVPCMEFIGRRIELHLSETGLCCADEEAA